MNEIEALKLLKKANRDNDMVGILPKSDIGKCLIKALEEVQQYRVIGTPEECRAAVEKQTARKGIREKIKKGYNRGMHHYYCPVCYEKGDLRNKYNVGLYCSDCGQKLDWEDEE